MSRYQVGVFPVTEDGKVVLVTSRVGGDWIFPKGNVEKGRSDRAVARDEAYEEAGLLGSMKQNYTEFKTPGRAAPRLRLFRMQVWEALKRYPESRQRKRAVVSFEKAAKMLSKDLRPILKKMSKGG
ncbi:NUDIX hydrolase [Haloferula sp.]|uniref:NUDIX hydrolase n=1 Tax=Haloferula sp. TaxID=2497595 RepID=UPI00329B3E88